MLKRIEMKYTIYRAGYGPSKDSDRVQVYVVLFIHTHLTDSGSPVSTFILFTDVHILLSNLYPQAHPRVVI